MVHAADGYFRSRFAHDERREAVWGHLAAYLARYVPPDASVLELGAGYCSFINRVAAARRVAFDLSAHVRDHAVEGVEACQGDAVELLAERPADEFDVVFASNVLEHLEWPQLDKLAPQVIRVLKPGGTLILLQPNFRLNPGRYFDDYTHRTMFTDESLRDWLTSLGFSVLRVDARFMPLTVKSRLSGLTFLVPLYLRLPWRPLAGQMLVVARKPASPDRAT